MFIFARLAQEALEKLKEEGGADGAEEGEKKKKKKDKVGVQMSGSSKGQWHASLQLFAHAYGCGAQLHGRDGARFWLCTGATHACSSHAAIWLVGAWLGAVGGHPSDPGAPRVGCGGG